jgi:signal transduction histidine kinase
VRLDAGREGRRVRFSVADTGPGVAPADRARIFNRFEQVKDAREGVAGPKGSGLGLAITKGLVEAQGGTIAVDAASGGGALFIVDLEASA